MCYAVTDYLFKERCCDLSVCIQTVIWVACWPLNRVSHVRTEIDWDEKIDRQADRQIFYEWNDHWTVSHSTIWKHIFIVLMKFASTSICPPLFLSMLNQLSSRSTTQGSVKIVDSLTVDVSRVESPVSGRLTIFIWAKGNVQLKTKQCPVISLRLIRCHICFRCSSVVVSSAIVTSLSMIADRRTTANHQEWEEKGREEKTVVSAREEARRE